jgi:cell division protein FtsB
VKKYGELMKEMDKKLEEVKANQQRMEDNMKNLKQEIIDEIRGSVSNISYMPAKELL